MSISRVDGEELESAAEEGAGSGKGTWKNAAFHVATTIATPAAYAPLPFAVASLGWPLGTSWTCVSTSEFMFRCNFGFEYSSSLLLYYQAWLLKWKSVGSLVLGTLTTWYSSLLVASLWQWNGKKHSTYRLLGKSLYGSWGYWSITMFQQIASLGNNIAIQIAAGSSLKAIYKYYNSDGSLTLQDFIIFFGALELLLSQLPDIHSLRWVNALCTFSTIGFAATTIGVTIYNGKNIDRDSISYGFHGSNSARIFRAFNALGAIAFSFGDAMLPEIQSTVREPAKTNMYKGVSAAYSIIILSYWQLAFSGYWAFGSQVQPYILSSLATPKWTIVMANIFAVIQISGCFQIYCRPTYAYFENQVAPKDLNGKAWLRKSLLRLCFTSIYMALITLVAAAMPFFGDFVSICGAVGFTPLDFVFPALAFLKAGKMPKNPKLRCLMQGVHLVIAVCFSVVAVLGCIGAVRFIVMDIKTYKFFHDM